MEYDQALAAYAMIERAESAAVRLAEQDARKPFAAQKKAALARVNAAHAERIAKGSASLNNPGFAH